MSKKDISTIVWWVPFKKTRDSLRNFLNSIFDMSQSIRLQRLEKNDFICEMSYIKRDFSERFNLKFYVPDYPDDLIQNHIVDNRMFFDEDSLSYFDKYIKDGSTILDIGGNIGNHSLYWGIVRKAQRIIAFEPCRISHDIFKKNIEINSLDKIITLHNFALGNTETKASLSGGDRTNIGGASIKPDDSGNMEIKTLDTLNLGISHIDFIKIDVEGFESYVLEGAKNIINKYKPTMVIEIYDKERLDKIVLLLSNLDYDLIDSLGADYIFAPKK